MASFEDDGVPAKSKAEGEAEELEIRKEVNLRLNPELAGVYPFFLED
ncbi:MAG: hypothetical protein QHH14_14095 [Clostridiales bacterium]|nr:hypothetical protein [Clostridiales bacterium]